MTKLKNMNCDETKKNQTVTKLKKKPKLRQISKTQTVIKFKKTNCDKT